MDVMTTIVEKKMNSGDFAEIFYWCEENIGLHKWNGGVVKDGVWTQITGFDGRIDKIIEFEFDYEEDAMAFKLRWM